MFILYIEKWFFSFFVSAGCNVLSTPFGIVIGSAIMRKFGRKPSLMSANIPWIIGWMTLSMASEFWTFFFGSALVGLSQGLCGCAVYVYAVEAAEPRLRGFFTMLTSMFYTVGIFVGHFLGIVFPWRISLGLYSFFPILSLLFGFFLTESPNWLMTEGRVSEAKESFFLLRGINPDSQREFAVLMDKCAENITKNWRCIIKNVLSATFFRPFSVLLVMMVISIGSGTDILIYYGIDILNRMLKTLDSEKVLRLINTVRILTGVLATFLIKKLKRKLLFFLSTFSTLFFLIAIIVSINYKLWDKLIILNICLYIGAANLGIMLIPWIMIAEVSRNIFILI